VAAAFQIREQLRAHLESFSDVQSRPEFGNVVYYVGGAQFAALTDGAALMHLPPAELTEALRSGVAKPFVSAGAMGRNGWVEMKLSAASFEDLSGFLDAAHRAAQHAHRRSRRRHPARAPRRRSTRST